MEPTLAHKKGVAHNVRSEIEGLRKVAASHLDFISYAKDKMGSVDLVLLQGYVEQFNKELQAIILLEKMEKLAGLQQRRREHDGS